MSLLRRKPVQLRGAEAAVTCTSVDQIRSVMHPLKCQSKMTELHIIVKFDVQLIIITREYYV